MHHNQKFVNAKLTDIQNSGVFNSLAILGKTLSIVLKLSALTLPLKQRSIETRINNAKAKMMYMFQLHSSS